MMTQSQTVIGFFDIVAEAQQAVQVLLHRGFTGEQLTLSTQTEYAPPDRTRPDRTRPDRTRPDPVRPDPHTNGSHATPTNAESSTGRFVDALFGNYDGNRTGDQPTRRDGAFVTVQVQSPAVAKQVADLLDNAGAEAISVLTAEASG